MHVFMMTRGISHYRDMWKEFMNSQMFWFKQKPILKDAQGNFLKNPDGTYQYGAESWSKVAGALRPIEFWEYVFPSETPPWNKTLPMNDQAITHVLAMLGNHQNIPIRKELQGITWAMRKMLGAQKIPEMPPEIAKIPTRDIGLITDKYIPMEAMAVYPFGVREDKIQDFIFTLPTGEKTGFFQEGI